MCIPIEHFEYHLSGNRLYSLECGRGRRDVGYVHGSGYQANAHKLRTGQ